MRARILITAVILSLFSAAQEPPPIRVTTRMVQVNVIVTGKGRPVADLKREDFTLLDEGRQEAIRVFSMESAAARSGTERTLPPNTFSNRPEHRSNMPNAVTAILFDQLNTPYAGQFRAKSQLIQFLEKMDPRSRIALYALQREVRVIHDFTSDAELLLAALRRHKNRLSGELQAGTPDILSTGNTQADQWLNDAEERRAHLEVHTRVLMTLNALESIAYHMARIPGRKNLVWISGSFPFNMTLREMRSKAGRSSARPTDYDAQVERCARAFSAVDVAVYPVHTSGVVTDPAFAADQGARAGYARVDTSQLTLQTLADRTGGKAYTDNDIEGAVRGAFEDSAVTYVLGYYPSHADWDGRFRALKVRVNRRGVQVRHRAGYFALPEISATEQERGAALREAVWSPLDASGIDLDVEVKATRPGYLGVSGKLNGGAIALEAGPEGSWSGTIDLLYVQQARDGRSLSGINDSVVMKLTPDAYQKLLRDGARFSRELRLERDAHNIRVVARDARSGRVGSLTIPVSEIAR